MQTVKYICMSLYDENNRFKLYQGRGYTGITLLYNSVADFDIMNYFKFYSSRIPVDLPRDIVECLLYWRLCSIVGLVQLGTAVYNARTARWA